MAQSSLLPQTPSDAEMVHNQSVSQEFVKSDFAEREKVFLDELASEIKWEWHWERRASDRWDWMQNLAVWARCVIVAATTFLLYAHGKPYADVVTLPLLFINAFCSLGSLLLPQYAETYKLKQRQEVHDRNARAFTCIQTQYKAGVISLAEAIEQYTKIRTLPTEKTIRSTP